MIRTKTDSMLKTGIASIALAAIALAFAPMAGAQAMGEYGAVVGNSAGAAVEAPETNPLAIPGTTVQADPSGTAATQVREDDSTASDAQNGGDESSAQSGDEWTEVKGSDDGN